jgi:hypothetical protein
MYLVAVMSIRGRVQFECAGAAPDIADFPCALERHVQVRAAPVRGIERSARVTERRVRAGRMSSVCEKQMNVR